MAPHWVQVVGMFDADAEWGEIVGVQPSLAGRETSSAAETTGLVLTMLDQSEHALSEVPVEVEFGSCDVEVRVGTFQTYLKLPEGVRSISLCYQGNEVHRMAPNQPSSEQVPAAESFGLGPRENHVVPLLHSGADPDATYTMQARGKGEDTAWQTIDICKGLPDASNVDVNQFPGAKSIEVRILKSEGFGTVELDRKEIEFER